MSQDRDIPKSDKSFEIKDIFLEVFFTYVEGNIDSPFSFSNLLNKRLPPTHSPPLLNHNSCFVVAENFLSAFLFCFEV